MNRGVDSTLSWVVMAACFFIKFLCVGLIEMAGILMIETMYSFDTTREKASLPYTLIYFTRNGTGPLIAYFGYTFGIRRIIFLGCIVSSAAIGSCFFAEDILTLTILWGILFGLGFAFETLLINAVLIEHFDKDVSKALGICGTGVPFGIFFFSNVLDWLFHNFGFSGCLLIISGISLNALPAALFILLNPMPPLIRKKSVISNQAQFNKFDGLFTNIISNQDDDESDLGSRYRKGDNFSYSSSSSDFSQNVISTDISEKPIQKSKRISFCEDTFEKNMSLKCIRGVESVLDTKLRRESQGNFGYISSSNDLDQNVINIDISEKNIQNSKRISFCEDTFEKSMSLKDIKESRSDLELGYHKENYDNLGYVSSSSDLSQNVLNTDTSEKPVQDSKIIPLNEETFEKTISLNDIRNIQSDLDSRYHKESYDNLGYVSSSSDLNQNVTNIDVSEKPIQNSKRVSLSEDTFEKRMSLTEIRRDIGSDLGSGYHKENIDSFEYTSPSSDPRQNVTNTDISDKPVQNSKRISFCEDTFERSLNYINNEICEVKNNTFLEDESIYDTSRKPFNEIVQHKSDHLESILSESNKLGSENCEQEKFKGDVHRRKSATKDCISLQLNGDEMPEPALIFKKSRRRPILVRLFCDPVFILLLISGGVHFFIIPTFLTLIVDYALDIGVEPANSKYILVWACLSELGGSLLLGPITDSGWMSPNTFTNLCFIGECVSMVLIVFCKRYLLLMITFYQFSQAGINLIYPVVVTESLEKELQSPAIASMFILAAPLTLAISPLIGFFRDGMQSYSGVFFTLSGAALLGATIHILIPKVSRYRKMKNIAAKF